MFLSQLVLLGSKYLLFILSFIWSLLRSQATSMQVFWGNDSKAGKSSTTAFIFYSQFYPFNSLTSFSFYSSFLFPSFYSCRMGWETTWHDWVNIKGNRTVATLETGRSKTIDGRAFTASFSFSSLCHCL